MTFAVSSSSSAFSPQRLMFFYFLKKCIESFDVSELLSCLVLQNTAGNPVCGKFLVWKFWRKSCTAVLSCFVFFFFQIQQRKWCFEGFQGWMHWWVQTSIVLPAIKHLNSSQAVCGFCGWQKFQTLLLFFNSTIHFKSAKLAEKYSDPSSLVITKPGIIIRLCHCEEMLAFSECVCLCVSVFVFLGLSDLIHDNLTESKRTINLLQRMNIYQEVFLSVLYRLLPIQVTHHSAVSYLQ